MATSGGKKNKKNKWKSVALEEVLPNTVIRSTTSWADEVENELTADTLHKITSISLPTAPRAACDVIIDESQIPADGPYIAYLSNLPYEIAEDDIAQQFKDIKITDIQLPKDSRSDRMRGFGYVQFKDKSMLISALHQRELVIKGRTVRISLASEDDKDKDKSSRSMGGSFTRNRGEDRYDGPDKTTGDWRSNAQSSGGDDKGPFRSNRRDYAGSSSRFDDNRDKQGSVFSRAFGGRDPERRGFQRFERDDRSGFEDRRSGSAFDSRKGGSFEDRKGGPFEDRKGGPFEDRKGGPFEDRKGGSFEDRKGGSFEDRKGGSVFFGRRGGGGRDDFRRSVEDLNKEAEQPKTRPKLLVAPRTIKTDVQDEPVASSAIFGGAKPVDTAAREREIEEKLSKVVSVAITDSLPRRNFNDARSSTLPRSGSRSSSVSSVKSTGSRQAIDSYNDISRFDDGKLPTTGDYDYEVQQDENLNDEILNNEIPDSKYDVESSSSAYVKEEITRPSSPPSTVPCSAAFEREIIDLPAPSPPPPAAAAAPAPIRSNRPVVTAQLQAVTFNDTNLSTLPAKPPSRDTWASRTVRNAQESSKPSTAFSSHTQESSKPSTTTFLSHTQESSKPTTFSSHTQESSKPPTATSVQSATHQPSSDSYKSSSATYSQAFSETKRSAPPSQQQQQQQQPPPPPPKEFKPPPRQEFKPSAPPSENPWEIRRKQMAAIAATEKASTKSEDDSSNDVTNNSAANESSLPPNDSDNKSEFKSNIVTKSDSIADETIWNDDKEPFVDDYNDGRTQFDSNEISTTAREGSSGEQHDSNHETDSAAVSGNRSERPRYRGGNNDYHPTYGRGGGGGGGSRGRGGANRFGGHRDGGDRNNYRHNRNDWTDRNNRNENYNKDRKEFRNEWNDPKISERSDGYYSSGDNKGEYHRQKRFDSNKNYNQQQQQNDSSHQQQNDEDSKVVDSQNGNVGYSNNRDNNNNRNNRTSYGGRNNDGGYQNRQRNYENNNNYRDGFRNGGSSSSNSYRQRSDRNNNSGRGYQNKRTTSTSENTTNSGATISGGDGSRAAATYKRMKEKFINEKLSTEEGGGGNSNVETTAASYDNHHHPTASISAFEDDVWNIGNEEQTNAINVDIAADAATLSSADALSAVNGQQQQNRSDGGGSVGGEQKETTTADSNNQDGDDTSNMELVVGKKSRRKKKKKQQTGEQQTTATELTTTRNDGDFITVTGRKNSKPTQEPEFIKDEQLQPKQFAGKKGKATRERDTKPDSTTQAPKLKEPKRNRYSILDDGD